MFSKIFTYEVLAWLRKPSFYLYLLAYSAIAFIAFIGSAGFFDGPEPESLESVQLLNSPFEINFILQYFNKLFLFLLPAIIGATIYKDFRKNCHSILYTFPIQKSHYLFGKFLSSFLLVAFITISVAVSMIIGEHIPGLHESKIGEFQLLGYLQALLVFTLPNMLIIGSIVFAMVTYFRNIYVGFLVVIVFVLLQNISQNLFARSDFWIALFDPFGQNTVLYETQYWSVDDRNTQYIPFFGVILYNRLLWLLISLGFSSIVYRKFQFHEYGAIVSLRRKKETKTSKEGAQLSQKVQLSAVQYSFSRLQQLKNCWKLSTIYFRFIARSWVFYVIVFLGILAVLFTIAKITNNNEVTLLPTTNIVLRVPAFFFATIIMLITFIYSGMLVHRKRASQIAQLIDTTAISNWELLISNLLALIKMQLALLSIMMIVGISIQTYNGYYHYEIDLYLLYLFGIQFIGLLIWAFAALFVHTIIKNTYLGIFALILLWMGVSGIKEMGIETNLLLFNFSEPLSYSDINGFGDSLVSFFLVKGYWLLFSIVLAIVSYALWARGVQENFKERLFLARMNLMTIRRKYIIIPFVLIVFLGFGLTIYQQEQSLELFSSERQNSELKQFKKEFSPYQNITNQPRITDVSLAMEMYPDTRNFQVKGRYILVNKTPKRIDTLLIKTGFDEITSIDLNTDFEVLQYHEYLQFYAIRLKKSLDPKDSLVLSFDIKNKPNTLLERNSNVLKNGTFLKKDLFPRIGYFLNASPVHPEETLARKNQLGTVDADFVHFQATIGTSEEQMVIAPGELTNSWTKNNRNYFQYQSPHPMKFSLAFISSKFEIEKEKYKGVSLEIYHHKNHAQNISKMMKGLKASLDYNQQYFGTYRYNTVKVVEFPMSEGVFATIMGNTIPTSERRFISNSNTSPEERFNPAFKVQAHELTHHWWGNTLIHANALGAAMLSESITEYITLKMYEHTYGRKAANDFLELQRKRYLQGRVSRVNEEPPLYLSRTSDVYLAYGKGSIAMNTLSHYLGEDKLNGVLKDFLNEYDRSESNYPTSIDLLQKLKTETPDSLQYLLKDYFEDTIFHDVQLEKAAIKSDASKFSVELDIVFSKHRKNNVEAKIVPQDYLKIGFYKNEQLIKIVEVKVSKIETHVQILLDKKPDKVVLDPHLLLLDKNIEDQTQSF